MGRTDTTESGAVHTGRAVKTHSEGKQAAGELYRLSGKNVRGQTTKNLTSSRLLVIQKNAGDKMIGLEAAKNTAIQEAKPSAMQSE